MCIIMLGERHTPVVCNESREPHTSHYPSRPVPKRNNQQTTHTSHYPTRVVENFYLGCSDKEVSKNLTICNKFLRTHLCRLQFLEHRPQCLSEKPLKSVVSKSCQVVDRLANDRAFYRVAC